jgi:geranylgeranyl pyrophosphate synthase
LPFPETGNLKREIQKRGIEEKRPVMASKANLIVQVRDLLWERGREGLEMARQSILQEKLPFQPLEEALRFFILNWEDVLHPAMLSLACEAVGGNPAETTRVSAALVLLAGGADVHDDVIDQSTIKDSKPTVYGKFGKDLAVLVGDALLFKGLYELHKACETLPNPQKQAILELTEQAFFGISSAEAKEASLRGKNEAGVAEEYLEMIKMKAAVGETTTKIGAVLGGGTPEQIEMLGHYGKTLAVLYTIRDEFIDAFELDELRNRVEKECLPLPILYTLSDSGKADKILRLLRANPITENELEAILDLVVDSKETEELKKDMRSMVEEENQHLHSAKLDRNIFMLLLRSMVEDL